MRYFYLLLFILFSSRVHAQVSMMEDVSMPYLDKLIKQARANYPKFKWTTAKVNAARAAYDKTRFGIFDFISLSYVYYPGNTVQVINGTGVSSALSGYQAGVFVNVGTMLQKPATIKQAKEEYNAARMDKDVTDLGLDQEVRRRYFTYIQTLNILKLRSRATADADDVVKNVKYKFEKGEVTFDIYNQSLLAFSTHTQEKIQAEANLLIARTNLEEIVGAPLDSIK